MRFLLDENLSPHLAVLLAAAGHPTVHVRDVGLSGSSDRDVLAWARHHDVILISADTDFGSLLQQSRDPLPSVILLRREADRSASGQARLLIANLEQVAADLQAGSIVVIETTRVRVRRLPLDPREPS